MASFLFFTTIFAVRKAAEALKITKTKRRFVMRRAMCALLIACFFAGFGARVCAAGGEGWYLCYRGEGSAPDFPESANEISEHGGLFIGNAEEKKIYLTFDAGYENGNIERILDVMSEKGVTGAFFILSNLIRKNPELVRRMADDGHLVCNHTSNHADMTRVSAAEMRASIERLEREYTDLTGDEMAKYFRFPEGKYTLDRVKFAESLGYRTVFWSLAYDDWDNTRQPNEERAIEKLTGRVHPGAIILLHPTSATNAAILGRLIDEWRAMGYTFARLDEI